MHIYFIEYSFESFPFWPILNESAKIQKKKTSLPQPTTSSGYRPLTQNTCPTVNIRRGELK